MMVIWLLVSIGVLACGASGSRATPSMTQTCDGFLNALLTQRDIPAAERYLADGAVVDYEDEGAPSYSVSAVVPTRMAAEALTDMAGGREFRHPYTPPKLLDKGMGCSVTVCQLNQFGGSASVEGITMTVGDADRGLLTRISADWFGGLDADEDADPPPC